MLELKCAEIENTINDNEEYQTQKKTIKGEVYFFLKNGYIETFYKEYTEKQKSYVNLYRTEIEVEDLIDGETFAEYVEDGCFIDYDGSISQIFVDDYKSNLGIWDKGIHQGEFCVGLYDFRRLCNQYKIEVDWVNK